MKVKINFSSKPKLLNIVKNEKQTSKKYITYKYNIIKTSDLSILLKINYYSDPYKLLNTILWIDDIIDYDNRKQKNEFSMVINDFSNNGKKGKIFWLNATKQIVDIVMNDTRYIDKKIYKNNSLEFNFNFYKKLKYSKKINLQTIYGPTKMMVVKQKLNNIDKTYTVFWKGNLQRDINIPVRIHYKCETSEIFDSIHCDCREQLENIKQEIFKNNIGLIIYSDDEGRGAGMFNKVNAYWNTEKFGDDTVKAYERNNIPVEKRCFRAPADIIKKLGIKSIDLHSNNPNKIRPLLDLGIQVKQKTYWNEGLSPYAKKYQNDKIRKMNHNIRKEYVLITGASGFIGKATAVKLIKSNVKVILLDKMPNLFFEENENIIYIKTDLTSQDLEVKLSKYKIITVMHFAGQSGVRNSNISQLFNNNVMATEFLIKLMKKNEIKNIIFASTSSVYGDIKKCSNEIDVAKPISLYAETKLTAEKLIRKSGLNYLILRYFTVYGENQRDNMAISKFISRALSKLKIKIYGGLDTYRDYTNIDDVVSANLKSLKLINKNSVKEVVNICSSNKIHMSKLVNTIKKHIPKIEHQLFPANENDVFGTFGDNSKAKNILSWTPKEKFKNTIKALVEKEKNNVIIFTDIKSAKSFYDFYKKKPYYKYVGYANKKTIKEIKSKGVDTKHIFSKIKNRQYRFLSALWYSKQKMLPNNIYYVKSFFSVYETYKIKNFNKPFIFDKKYNRQQTGISIFEYCVSNTINSYLSNVEQKFKKLNNEGKAQKISNKIALLSEIMQDPDLVKLKMSGVGNEGIILKDIYKNKVYKVTLKINYDKQTLIQKQIPKLKKACLSKVENTMILPKFRNLSNNKAIILEYSNNILPINKKIDFFDIFFLLFQQSKIGIFVDDLKTENFGVIYKEQERPRVIYNDIGRSIYKKDPTLGEYWEGIIRDYLIFYKFHTNANDCHKQKSKARGNKNKDVYPIQSNIAKLQKIFTKEIAIFNAIDYKQNKNIINICICSMPIKEFLKKYKLKNKVIKICNLSEQDTLSYSKEIIENKLIKTSSYDYKRIECSNIDIDKLRNELIKHGYKIKWKDKKDSTFIMNSKDKLEKAFDHILWKIQ